jgi:hypothetical protein
VVLPSPPRAVGMMWSHSPMSSPSLLPPGGREVLRLHEGVLVAGEHAQLSRIPEDSGAPPVTLWGGWQGGGKSRCQSLAGALQEERCQHAPWRGTRGGGPACLSVPHACLEPGGTRPSPGWAGGEWGEQGVVTAPVEALVTVGL